MLLSEKSSKNLDAIPPNVDDEVLKETYSESDKYNWTKDKLESYDFFLMREQDERGRIELAERRTEEKNSKKRAKINCKKSEISRS